MAELQGQNNSMHACIQGQASEVQRLQQVLALLQAPEAINVEDQHLKQLRAQPPNSATISQLLGTPLLTEPLGTLPHLQGGTAGQPNTHHPAPTRCEDFPFESGIEQGKDTMSKSEDLTRQQTCVADQVQSKRGSNSSDDNDSKRPKNIPNPALDQDNLVGAQQPLLPSRFRDQGLSLDETRDLCPEDSAIDLDMFEVSFLETKNDSSAGTGAGTGAGTNNAELVGDGKPAGAEATCTVDDQNEAEATSSMSLLQALATCCGICVAFVWHISADWGTAPFNATLLTETAETRRMANQIESSALWALVDGNEDYMRLSLSVCCLLGAVCCGNLPAWLEEAVRKLELEDATIKAVRRTWIRIYYCGLLPVFQIGGAFLTFQESGSSQTAIIQDLCVAVVIV